MKYSISFNEKHKQINISAQIPCEWTCVRTSGNITLSKYYGSFTSSGSTDINIFTYGTETMYGEFVCYFKNNQCAVSLPLTIESLALPYFYVNNTNLFLFGEKTRTYLYIYYDNPRKDNPTVLDSLLITIGDSILTYNGQSYYYVIQENGMDLYNIIFYSYESNYVKICFESKTNYAFQDTVKIEVSNNNIIYDYLKKIIIVKLQQTEIKDLPSLLEVNPSFVFLNSLNPQQKINVRSLHNGQYTPFYISNTQPTKTNNNVDNTLDVSILTKSYANHFIIDMSDQGEDADNVGNDKSAYELYVISQKNEKLYKKIEIFYDYIIDTLNDMYITKINGGAYYVDKDGEIKKIENTSFSLPENLINLNIKFIKLNDSLNNENIIKNCVYVIYNKLQNITFTIASPSNWIINKQSDYIREVKNGNDLVLSLEKEIPNEQTESIVLQNTLGKKCSFYIQNEENLFNENQYIFGLSKEGSGATNVNLTLSGDSYCFLTSQSTEEQFYYFDTIVTKNHSSATTLSEVATLSYEQLQKNQQDVTLDVKNEDYDVYFDQNINKQYILYGSSINGEIKDVNKYYFEADKTKIKLPKLQKTDLVPWHIISYGNGVVFDLFEGGKSIENNKQEYIYIPQSKHTKINILTSTPKKYKEGEIYLIIKNTLSYDDIFTIIFQQINSLKKAFLFVKYNSNINSTYFYQIGPSINDLHSFNYSDFTTSYFGNPTIEINIVNEKMSSLYYASYKKEKFSYESYDVNFDIVEEYDIKPNNEIELIKFNSNIDTLYSGITSAYCNSISSCIESLEKSGTLINNWHIDDSYLIINENEEKRVFLSDKQQKLNNDEYIWILTYDNESNEESKTYFLFKKKKSYIIDKLNIDIKDITESVSTSLINCYYEIIPKTLSILNEKIKIDKYNKFIYNNNTYSITQTVDGKWIALIPSLTIKSEDYNKINGLKKLENEIYQYVYKDKIYDDTITIKFDNNFNLPLLENYDYNDNDKNKEKYIIINDKKYILDDGKIQFTPLNVLQLNSNNYVNLKGIEINALKEGGYDYISIEDKEYIIVNNKVVYDGVEYQVIIGDANKWVVINNQGFLVISKKLKYYFILNNKKYEINENLNIDCYDVNGDNVIGTVKELINENFEFHFDMSDLLKSEIINGKISIGKDKYPLINGYISGETIYPMTKKVKINYENLTYNIISEEVIENGIINNNPSTIIMHFYDDTHIIIKHESSKYNIEGNYVKDDELKVRNKEIITINDYSTVHFNNNNNETILVKFENDCEIIYKGNKYFYNKNEHVLLPCGDDNLITFTDITTFVIGESDLYVFENMICQYKDNEIIQLFSSKLINNQNAFIYENNTYYIYHQQEIEINGFIFKNIDKCVFVRSLSDNMITNFNEIICKKDYGYIKGNKFNKINFYTSQKDITWKILLPYFDENDEQLKIGEYSLINFKSYEINDKTIYKTCDINDYNNKTLSIQNGYLKLNVNSYKILTRDSNHYTNSDENYIFRYNNINYSIWDYYANTWCKQIKFNLKSGDTITINSNIALENVEFVVDENLYFEIHNDFKEIKSISWKQINPSQESISLDYWNIDDEKIENKSYDICNINLSFYRDNDLIKTEKKYYVKNYMVFSSSSSISGKKTIETNIQNQSNMYYVIVTIDDNEYKYTASSMDILKEKIQYDHYKKYIVSVDVDNNTIKLTEHSNTFLNQSNKIQVASTYKKYDDKNEAYEFYVFDEGQVYNVNFGVVTIPTNLTYYIIDKDNKKKCLILYPLENSLNCNLKIDKSYEKSYNAIQKIDIKNVGNLSNKTKIIIAKTNIAHENIKFAKCLLKFS